MPVDIAGEGLLCSNNMFLPVVSFNQKKNAYCMTHQTLAREEGVRHTCPQPTPPWLYDARELFGHVLTGLMELRVLLKQLRVSSSDDANEGVWKDMLLLILHRNTVAICKSQHITERVLRRQILPFNRQQCLHAPKAWRGLVKENQTAVHWVLFVSLQSFLYSTYFTSLLLT